MLQLRFHRAKICFDRWRCSRVEHSWVLVIRDRTVDGISERHCQSSLGDKGSSHERQMARRVRGQGRVMTEKRKTKKEKCDTKKPKKIRFKVSAFIPTKIQPSRLYMTVVSVYHLHKWPVGRLKALACKSVMSIFIE